MMHALAMLPVAQVELKLVNEPLTGMRGIRDIEEYYKAVYIAFHGLV